MQKWSNLILKQTSLLVSSTCCILRLPRGSVCPSRDGPRPHRRPYWTRTSVPTPQCRVWVYLSPAPSVPECLIVSHLDPVGLDATWGWPWAVASSSRRWWWWLGVRAAHLCVRACLRVGGIRWQRPPARGQLHRIQQQSSFRSRHIDCSSRKVFILIIKNVYLWDQSIRNTFY